MHQPVLLKEVLDCLNPLPGENFIDCTIGFGGHAFAILERITPKGRILGIELDQKVLKKLKLPENIILVQGNFADLKKIVEENNFSLINGILFDLGMSSWQLEQSNRGFSFQKDEPLDMRFGNDELTAEKIINNWPEEELIKIFQEYSQERYARQIAKKIYENRPINRTIQLVEVIKQAVPKKYQHQRLHFATRTFQALRIAVNDELNNLTKALPQALEILEPKGRLVVISFHSLEDKIVKNFFKEAKITNYLIRPSQEEIKSNPRSRSAKLRAALKV